MSMASIQRESSDSISSIFRSLNFFKSQVSRFAVFKGFIAALTTLCCGMYLLILLDSSGVASDIIRWLSSIGVYVASLIMGWLAGWKRFFWHPSKIQLAVEVEKLHPHFGERLSSSVELHFASNTQLPGSTIFVETVQRQAHKELNRVDLKGLVPWQSLNRWIGLLGLLVATIVALCCIPSLQFTNKLARAMLPFVDIPVPTSWNLLVISPNVSDFVVPSDQNLDFRLLATSLQKNEPLPKQANLECRDTNLDSFTESTLRVFPLKIENSEENVYSTIAPIGDKPMSYRFLFGDSKTNWRKVTPVQRPSVKQFHWTIDFPAYTLLPSEKRSSDTGDLRVLKESHLVLSLAVNQPLMAGSIVVENADSGNQQVVPLHRQTSRLDADRESEEHEFWQCELNAQHSGRFQVKLESKHQFQGTPITNTFSPWYKLDVTSDPPANVDWVATEETPWAEPNRSRELWMVQPDDWIALVCEVKDNLPILSLSSEISINDQPWTDVALHSSTSPALMEEKNGIYQSRTSLGWDVASTVLSEGDVVSLRLKVVDRAETTSYSSPLKFSIASTGFEKNRYKTLEKRAELVPLLEKLQIHLKSNQEDFLSTVAQIQSRSSVAEDTLKDLQKIRDWTESVSSITSEIQLAIQNLMPQLERCIDQNELELVARALARIDRERLNTLRFCSDQQLFLDRQRLTAKLPEWANKVHQETCERMGTQWKTASRDADRLLEIYRSFVSLELQTSLTKDMTNLLAHQRKQIASPANKDLASLVRSQLVAERYWQLANGLAIRIAPSARKEFAKRIPEWQKWMENSRQEIRDLCIPDGDLPARAMLVERIGRDVVELEGQRWIYNYDSAILWKADELRRELMLQSGSLASQFDALLKLHPRRNELIADRSLSSQELAVKNRTLIRNAESITDSIRQLTDRRDMHQLRKHQDPMFGSDMGLAWRAWNAVFVQWKTESAAEKDSLAKDLSTIYGAYRTLEAAHEMAEAKLAISSLQSPERYDYQTLDGQLQHNRQWDSIASRIDTALQWMRSAQFPNEVIESYSNIRNSKPFTTAQQLFSQRRDPQNKVVVSAARELDTLLSLWNKNDQLATPYLEKARWTLSQFAPSVADLAKKAAEKTRQLQQQTSVLQEPEATTNKNGVQSGIREQQKNVNEQVKILQDALIEQAAKQNLLQQSQRELAKDSDRALKLLEQVTDRMNESLANALEKIDDPSAESSLKPNANSDPTQKDATKHALNEQQVAIDTFDSIAQHFEDNSTTNSAERSNQPDKLSSPDSKEMAMQPSSDSSEKDADAYQRAEALEKQLQENSDSMLKQLEEELRKNPLMQGELSEISKSHASSAASKLQLAALTEQQLKLGIENEDAELFEAKKAKSDKLHALVDLAERTAAKTLERASQMSQRASLPENQNSIQSLHERLRSAISDARQVHERTPAAEQDEAIARLASRLDELMIDARSSSEISERSIRRPIETNEQRRINKVNEAKNAQNSIRDELAQQIKQITNNWREAGKRAESRTSQLKKDIESIEKQRDNWLKSQKPNLAKENVQEDLRRWTSQLDQSIAKLKEASLSESAFRDVAKRAEDQFKSIVQRERASLDQPNPYAALATEQLANTNRWLEDLVQQARELAANPVGAKPPAPPESTLSQSATMQSELRKELGRIAEDIDRSARHEQRLGNDLGSSQLTEQSSKIRETESGIVKEAEESLSKTSQETKQAERNQSKPDAQGNVAKSLKRPSAAKPMEQLGQSMDALNARANDLAALNQSSSIPASGSESPSQSSPPSQKADGSSPTKSPTSPPTNGSPSSNQSKPSNSVEQTPLNRNASTSGGVQQKATEMARMLDQLDRDIYAQQSPTETGDSKENGETDVSRSEPNSGSNKIRNGKGNMSSARQSAIESSAQQLASEMNQSRMEQKNRNPGGQTYLRNQKGAQSGGEGAKGPNSAERAEDYFLPNSQSSNDRDWGKLRTQRAVDVKEGTRESFDPEFDQAIRAYYQAIGDAASGR